MFVTYGYGHGFTNELVRQVTEQRGRQCVSVKAGRQSELPIGSIKLGSSRSGATVYMQPQPLVELNNTYSQLADMVVEAERKVLAQLSQQVAENNSQLFKASICCLGLYGHLG